MARSASTCTSEIRAEFGLEKTKLKQKEDRIAIFLNLKTRRKITRDIKIIVCMKLLIIHTQDLDSKVSP